MSIFDFYPGSMSKPVKILLSLSGILLVICLLGVSGFVAFTMLTEFRPPMKSKPEITGNGRPVDPSRRSFTFFTWNIGYAGLGYEMDFFYDGGKKVRPERDKCTQYFEDIKKLVTTNDSADFIFLQEVDVHSKRAWYTDEYKGLSSALPGFSGLFTKNYDCRFVPVPLQDPMGRVVSGLATWSRLKPESAEVHYFNAFFPWPRRLVFLKRCFVLMRFGLDNGKQLVILNTHNSAYDSTGELRKRELAMLDSVMESEYGMGNYVIAGGDWNNNPQGFKPSTIISGDAVTTIDPVIEPGFLPGWQFIFDPSQPTNRNVDMAYEKGKTKTTIIDFYVVSPNVGVTSIKTIPTGFENSDHQPVVMGIRLK